MNEFNYMSLDNVVLRFKSPVISKTPDSANKENKKIALFIKNNFNRLTQKDIKDLDQIKIESHKISYFSKDDNQWKEIRLSPESRNKLMKIFKRIKEPILIEHDRVGDMILSEAQRTLYLYSSGGGGHKAAKDAKLETHLSDLRKSIGEKFNEKEILDDERFTDSAKFVQWCKQMDIVPEIDVLRDYLGKVGEWASVQWDEAQKAGDVKKQEKLASKQWLSDFIFGPFVFISTLKSLIKYKPKTIVSTQAMATPSILLAIEIYNRLYKPKGDKDVELHLYMTDLPTEYSGHFFDALKRLTKIGGKDHLVLHAPKPKNETDWKILCGLPNNQVVELTTDELPVRPAFVEAAGTYHSDPEHPQVQIKVTGTEELSLLRGVLKFQGKDSDHLGDLENNKSQLLNYEMNPGDQGYFLMLGSQPTRTAIEEYVDKFIDKARTDEKTHYHLFAFTGRFEPNKASFYKDLSEYIKTKDNWPSNLSVLPLSFQDPQQLVSLELQCHTITRSGGSTIMELLVLDEVRKKLNLPPKKHLVHAQKVEGRSLDNSIPLWEKGNFYFLRDYFKEENANGEAKTKVKAVDPDTLFRKAKRKGTTDQ